MFILTDDQRWDSLESMPYLAQLASEGIRFDNAMVTTPSCNPVRASVLSGGLYAAQTGIIGNTGGNADIARFRHEASIGVTLQELGYATGFVGKYMNNFRAASARMLEGRGNRLKQGEAYIPPGWTFFAGTTTRENLIETPWHRFELSRGSSKATWDAGTVEWADGHIEERQREWALDFLSTQSAREPFFLMVSTHAPHEPAIPEAQDAKLFSDFVYRGRAYAEADIDDKPAWIEDSADKWESQREDRDEFHRNQLRTLRSVDRLLREVTQQLEETGLLNDTLFLITSDNGSLWGEHRAFGKNKAFEESIRVPLVIWRPGMTAARVRHLVAANLDVSATILDIAGADATKTSGASLGPFVDGGTPRHWRSELVLESYADPAWLAVRRLVVGDKGEVIDSHKYVEYYNGDRELYDLSDDRLEEESRHEDLAMIDTRDALAASLPIARGPVILGPRGLLKGNVGTALALVPEFCCDDRPLAWDISRGTLPPGLVLDGATGRIGGVPTEAGRYRFALRVRTDRVAVPGRPGFFVRDYVMSVAR